MSADKSSRAWLIKGLMATVVCLVIAQTDAYSAQSSQPTQKGTTRQAPFTLTIQDNLISLTARDASIKAILEEIGRRMNIAVVAAIPPEESITMEFAKLPLKDALTRLSTSQPTSRTSSRWLLGLPEGG